jgi:leucine dehydrogenase
MDVVRLETEHVAGLTGGVGDPSPWTARGVFRAIQAAATHRWGAPDLQGRAVAIQGCGNVGANLARELAAVGARLVVADVDETRARRVAAETGAEVAPAGAIHAVAADVFAPCALGGVIDDATVAALQAEIVAGAANNQLLEDRHGTALADRGILYAPDYVANAGGVLSGTVDLLGWPREEAWRRLEAIYDTMLSIFETAMAAGVPPHRAADRLAEERLGAR